MLCALCSYSRYIITYLPYTAYLIPHIYPTLPYSTLPYSTLLYSTLEYSTLVHEIEIGAAAPRRTTSHRIAMPPGRASGSGQGLGWVCLYPILPYHTIPYHTIPYHTIPYPIIPYHILSYHTIPYHTIPYRTAPHRISSCILYSTLHSPGAYILYHSLYILLSP